MDLLEILSDEPETLMIYASDEFIDPETEQAMATLNVLAPKHILDKVVKKIDPSFATTAE